MSAGQGENEIAGMPAPKISPAFATLYTLDHVPSLGLIWKSLKPMILSKPIRPHSFLIT